ncbi:MAG TPA: alpha/beta fold hydrolase [Polyangia bacterium]|nr:alpha/beta fold hydrolase [Polyangia bacterium]
MAANPFLAALEEQHRTLRRWLSLPRVIETALETRVGTTAREVVMRSGTHELLRYSRGTPAAWAEPVLLCYALVNRPYILDLEADKSVVRQYLDAGFDVYLIDWGVPSDADKVLGLEHYVAGFLARAVDFILRRHGRPRLHLLGYCMGGTLSALHGALAPETLASLTLLAAPIDFGERESLLTVWTGRDVFDVDAFVDEWGNCPAWFLQTCFLMMNPVRNLVDKTLAFWEHMEDGRAVQSHFALEHWLNDNIPVAGETFREFVKKLYQGNELVRGALVVGGRRVDLARITCPLLLLTAEHDHLVAPAATEGIRPHVGARDVTSMGASAGHVGLVVGAKAHARLWPAVTRWVAERSTPLSAPARAAAPDPASASFSARHLHAVP